MKTTQAQQFQVLERQVRVTIGQYGRIEKLTQSANKTRLIITVLTNGNSHEQLMQYLRSRHHQSLL